ncbi:hypothetical protein C8R46DRAFT_1030579 [Mycena filopes]|nr:hypothetical protein C8R46DRAFT_1030579 [Mycena filopes]
MCNVVKELQLSAQLENKENAAKAQSAGVEEAGAGCASSADAMFRSQKILQQVASVLDDEAACSICLECAQFPDMCGPEDFVVPVWYYSSYLATALIGLRERRLKKETASPARKTSQGSSPTGSWMRPTNRRRPREAVY